MAAIFVVSLAGCGPDPSSVDGVAPTASGAASEAEATPTSWPSVSSITLCRTGKLYHGPPNRPVLQWWPDGSKLLFGGRWPYLYEVAADSTWVRETVGAPRNGSEPYWRIMDGNVSPDGTKIAYVRCEQPEAPPGVLYEIAVWDSSTMSTRRFTMGHVPVWSPDGTRIAFTSSPLHPRPANLYTMAPGVGDRQRLALATVRPPRWSPDGTRLAFVQDDGYRNFTISVIAADGSGQEQPLTPTVSDPSWSPDGTRIAFAAPDGEKVALFTIAADGTDRRRVADTKGWDPVYGEPDDPRLTWIETVEWSPDGTRILYSCGQTVCVVTPGERPVTLAEGPGVIAAWSPDGTRIAILDPDRGPLVRTMAPDGSNLRILVVGSEVRPRLSAPRGPEVGPRAAAPRPVEGPVDVAGCAAGTAVAEPAANPGLVEDCETLLVVQARLAGVGAFGWTTDRRITEWDGVVLGDEPLRVRQLTLAGSGLTGVIPPELARLTQLARLDLSQNRFSGVIPPELGALSELRVLDLGWNTLVGTIPAELAGLTKLRELDLGRNYLTGALPPDFAKLTELGVLILDGNQLTGCIPRGIGWRVVDRSFLGLPYCEAA